MEGKKRKDLLFKAEMWAYYKEHFKFSEVVLVGQPHDIYKVYCLSQDAKEALYIDLKTDKSMNKVGITRPDQVPNGNLTTTCSVKMAIQILDDCTYKEEQKPNSNRFREVIELLKANESQ